jgi:hypothetical protein
MAFPDKLYAYDSFEGGNIYECPHDVQDFESLADTCE